MSLLQRVAALRSHLSDTGESLPDLSARLTIDRFGVKEAAQAVDHLESEVIDGISALQEFAALAKQHRTAISDQVDQQLDAVEIKVDGWLGPVSTPEIVAAMEEAGVDDITEDGALDAMDEAMQELMSDGELPVDAPTDEPDTVA